MARIEPVQERCRVVSMFFDCPGCGYRGPVQACAVHPRKVCPKCGTVQEITGEVKIHKW